MLTLIALESTDTMSGAHTGEHLRHLLLWVGIHLGERQLELLNLVLRKAGHMVGYGLLCFCLADAAARYLLDCSTTT